MKNKITIFALIALIVAVGILLGVWIAAQQKQGNDDDDDNKDLFTILDQQDENDKEPVDEQDEVKQTFSVIVVHKDKTERTFTYETDAQKLGSVLEQEGLIIGSGDGMFHTVDLEKTDWNEKQSYWAFYVGDDYAVKGIYDTDIEDGAQYKLVYTIG